jgi:hypothetical protein
MSGRILVYLVLVNLRVCLAKVSSSQGSLPAEIYLPRSFARQYILLVIVRCFGFTCIFRSVINILLCFPRYIHVFHIEDVSE